MSDRTHIEWTDATWNPVTGCSVFSPGCANCYAMKLAGTRLQHHPSRAGLTRAAKAGPVWTGEVRFNELWLDQPLRWRKPRRIFVCAHADLFHDSVPDEWIDRVFAVMALAPQHTFQLLTKRSARMREYLTGRNGMGNSSLCTAINAIPSHLGNRHGALEMPLPNAWLGVSVEDQTRADERIPDLLATPAAVRWISAEPLLGPVDLTRIPGPVVEPDDTGYYRSALEEGSQWYRDSGPDYDGKVFSDSTDGPLQPSLDWVVCGGESGPGARPMQPDWARSLRDQCAEAAVPFHFKQWGEWLPSFGHRPETPGYFAMMERVGKKTAGRLLDGVQHDRFPA